MDNYFPESEPVDMKMACNLEVVCPINRCTDEMKATSR